MGYWVYILRCADGTLYTGSTDDVDRRAAAHNSGRGAKYTRGRGPVAVVYREECPDKSAALKREAAIKRLTRPQKLALLAASPTPSKEVPHVPDHQKGPGRVPEKAPG